MRLVSLSIPVDTMENGESRSQNSPREGSAVPKPLALDYAPSTSLISENVMFKDVSSGAGQTRGSAIDPVRDSYFTNDATLDNFFSRPVKIRAFDWQVGGDILETFNPWSDYWQNALVAARINRYKLLRATLKVKFVINGNPFFYGRAIAAYNPFPTQDNITQTRALDQDVIAGSQRPHVFLNPTTSSAGELELPFFTYLNVIDIAAADWQTMGTMWLYSLQQLKHANGATGAITISVFAWAENVKFSTPTGTNGGQIPLTEDQNAPQVLITPSADEYGTGPVSRPASIVAKVASAITSVPAIGPFALATQVGANAIARVASIFGYCSPPRVEFPPLVPVARSSLANTDLQDEVVKLSVGVKQELTIDPQIAGLKSDDEMTLSGIACRESFLTNFTWAVDTPEEEFLFNVRVDPCVHGINTTFNDPEIHLPACAFATLPFQYWKGTMRYRFQIVSSMYHKGRLKIVYDPTASASNVDYNTAYTTVIDIAEHKDFTLDVGWAQPTAFREHVAPGISLGSMYGIVPITAVDGLSNGFLSIYVVNELTTPNSEVNNDIEINVFVSCVDLEVAAPTGRYLDTLYLQNTPLEALSAKITPSADEVDHGVTPTDPETIRMVASTPSLDNALNMVYCGDPILSFRTLLKRYMYHEPIFTELPSVSDMYNIEEERQVMPFDTGYSGTGALGVNYNFDTDLYYTYCKFPLINYVRLSYGAWRGGIRYMLDVSSVEDTTSGGQSSNTRTDSFTISRVPAGIIRQGLQITGIDPPQTKRDMLFLMKDSDGYNGTTKWNSQVNPFHSFEVPYYSLYRFAPSKRRTNFEERDQFQPGWKLTWTDFNDDAGRRFNFNSHVSVGEDFNCLMYLGPPVYFYRTTIPLQPPP